MSFNDRGVRLPCFQMASTSSGSGWGRPRGRVRRGGASPARILGFGWTRVPGDMPLSPGAQVPTGRCGGAMAWLPFSASRVPLPVVVWPWLVCSGTRSWPESPSVGAWTRTPLAQLSTGTASPGTSAPAPAAAASWMVSVASGYSCVSGAASWCYRFWRHRKVLEKWHTHKY